MKNIQSVLSYNKLISLMSVIVAVLLLLLIPSFSSSIDDSVTSSFRFINNEAVYDTNIVIIGINDSDIRQLGGWPIKRSYYAILINYLSRYEPAKIGLEVFLSQRASSLDIYDQLLLNEISKSDNIILSSQLENLNILNYQYLSDSISYPSPKLKSRNLKTAHINYINNGNVIIPSAVNTTDGIEYAFSVALSNIQIPEELADFRINFSHSWRSYTLFGLVEFLQLAEANDSKLEQLRNKSVLIGVTDPTIARNLSSFFDNHIPGVGVHAIAADNLNSETYLKNNLKIVSAIFFVSCCILISLFPLFKNRIYNSLIIFFTFYVVSLFLFNSANLEFEYSFYLLPIFLMFVSDLVYQYALKDKMLMVSIDEKAILEKALATKEAVLSQLEKDLQVNGQNESVIEKINKLKTEIDDLKNAKRDEEVEDEQISKNEVKNFFGIVYVSNAMHKVVKMIEKVASQNATVMILGESGSGKELVANAIHQLSIRKAEPFIAVNCAALTESLLESELFGHVKGAFTNAVADKKGMFEAADKGTIFLDEIGETNETFQVKLLRVLQSGEVQKVGATNTIYVDARIIAATNKVLTELIAEKKFREDLYYRLNVITIDLPPLRDRKEDIPVLAAHFAGKEDSRLRISKAVIDQFSKIEWKGNVRELESVIKRAAIFAKSENRTIIKIGDLPESLTKIDKSNLENLILSSMREKQFSHTSINETGKELGGLSRIIVSENVRGIFFKHFFMNEFNFEKAVQSMAGFNDQVAIDKLTSKGNTYIKNIKKDLEKLQISDFEAIKSKFNSKYKNLPQKYHHYLDETIKYLIAN